MEKLWVSCAGKLTSSLKDQRGSVLIFSLLILSVISTYAMTSLILNTNEYSMSQSSIQAAQAYYLAEAGLEEAIIKIKQEPDKMESFSESLPTGNYLVRYIQEENNILRIVSKGRAQEGVKKLQARLEISSVIIGKDGIDEQEHEYEELKLKSEQDDAEGECVNESKNIKYEIRLLEWW